MRIRSGFPVLAAALALAASPTWAAQEDGQNAAGDDPMVLYDKDGTTLRAHLQAGGNLVAEHNLFWRFAETVAGVTDFDPNAEWFEAYVKPGLTFERRVGERATFYGGLSAVASMTVGTDAFDAGDTGRATLEEGYLGWRYKADETTFDVSVGPRVFKAGTGMLIEAGGSSGFSRGALKLGPRKAWAFAALGEVSRGGFKGTAFYLDPNESPDNDSHNRLAGVDLRYDTNPNAVIGLTAGKVLESESPYPKAPPGGIGVPSIIPGARDGLQFANLYIRSPLRGAPNAFMAADLAVERNDRIDLRAWAGRVQIGYAFAEHRWKPTFTLGYQTFSGDDPDTPRLERFDPLYYEGNPSAWSTGTKSSMVFINSNVNSWQVAVSVAPTPQDTLTARLHRIEADQLRSPIQFGQATRVTVQNGVNSPITGVTRHHLSDDLYVEYFRAISANLYLTTGFSVSVPGAGTKSIVEDAPVWAGAYVNLIANY
ncbi:alginate export family protein [Brevundimonas sp. P7753]|uniref:alginate export family protein n=1 Tax=Brevundimonas sp. P7753 TaxID=2726982 RepID=UPI0015BF3DA1|nr:alginate export family protein [Brevundimonas sp. P7753]NWE53314.1 alginate export family protein [Brevundimonas sp. P7753]